MRSTPRHIEVNRNFITIKTYEPEVAEDLKRQLEAVGSSVKFVADPVAMGTSAVFAWTEDELYNFIDSFSKYDSAPTHP